MVVVVAGVVVAGVEDDVVSVLAVVVVLGVPPERTARYIIWGMARS